MRDHNDIEIDAAGNIVAPTETEWREEITRRVIEAIIPPFYMITRYGVADDLRPIEREITAALGITAVDDFDLGLCFNREADARAVASAMAERLDRVFFVVSSADDIHAKPPRYIAFGPSGRATVAEINGGAP